ncbi:MAG: putative hydrolase of the HAD superfamily [Verrucomicrobiales bacterium]|jgi:putative hydrolase of the HAD superfamily
MNTTTLRAIFFDAAGTLFRLRESVGEGYARVGKEFGIRLDPTEADVAFRLAWKSAKSPFQSETSNSEREWWRGVVGRVLAECGQPMKTGYFDTLWAHYAKAETWELFDETREVLQQLLSGRLRLGVISNFDERLHSILEGHGLAEFFDPIVISSEVGARKPSAKIYEVALDRASCSPDEALHVGDEAEADWEGARAAGLNVFELKRPETTLLDALAEIENWRVNPQADSSSSGQETG